MTLEALRLAVGDDTFFRILRTWTTSYAGQVVDTGQFISLADRISGRDLGTLFTTWLYTAERPAGLPAPSSRAAVALLGGSAVSALPAVRSQVLPPLPRKEAPDAPGLAGPYAAPPAGPGTRSSR